MAFQAERDTHLRAVDASHLFENSTTRIGIARNHYLRGYAFAFIQLFAPQLTREVVETAMRPFGREDEGINELLDCANWWHWQWQSAAANYFVHLGAD